MTADRAHSALQLFEKAFELTGPQRDAFLEQACANDEELRRELEMLLGMQNEAGDFLPTHDSDISSGASSWLRSAASSLAEPSNFPDGLAPGAELAGRYRIENKLGAGGMGEVYRAFDSRLDREVAIKVLKPESLGNSHMRERFDREMKAVAALSHPNIVTLFDVADDGRLKFAVMELVKGHTLRELICDGLDWKSTVELTCGIALGLSAAHARNLVHRDIKPENVVVAADHHAKVLDFGLARPEEPTTALDLTGGRVIPGTVPYMSPEQAAGDELACSTDVFSLGTVVFEMLTGQNPFRATTAAETVRRVMEANPPALASFVRNVPDRLIHLVLSLLHRDPARRPTAEQIIAELKPLRPMASSSACVSPATDSAIDSPVPTNLPRRRAALTGRETEVSSMSSRLDDHAVVTILGPGGVGKTSIALEVARTTLGQFPGGIWLCEFAPLRKSDDVIEAIAGAIDGNAGSMRGLDEVVTRLQGAPAMLVFDNCEHVVDAAADIAESLSERLPNLAILATSRESLNVPGEYVNRLEGLDYEGLSSDAANLFAERATAAAGYEDAPERRAIIQKIVTRLEGLPLAIELAAPKLAAMSLEELLDALADQLSTLQSRRRSRDRQGTIDRAISWSFDLLEKGEQEILLALSVFTGSFTREAAVDICDFPSGAKTGLQRLVEQSVIVRQERRGRSRYRLLEPIRQFCQSRIAPAANEAARKRHAFFYADRAISLGEGIHGNNELEAAAALNAEWSDLREATSWGRQHALSEIAVDPVIALARTIMFHLRTEAYLWLMEAETQFGESVADRADVQCVIANGHWVMGNPELAERYLERAESQRATPQSMWAKYFLRFSQKRFKESSEAAERARELAEASGDDVELRWWRNALRTCPLTMADPSDPRVDESLASAIDFVTPLDWPTGKAFLHLAKATVAMTRGKLADALRFRNEAVEYAASCSNRWVELIAKLVVDDGLDPSVPPQERLAAAIKGLRSLIDLGEEAHYPLAVRSVILGMIACESFDAAARSSAIVESLRGVGDKDEFSPQYRPSLEQLKSALGEVEFERLRKEGLPLTVQDIADLADGLLE